MIDSSIVDKLLDMSRLDIDSSKKATFIKQIGEILQYVENIAKIDTSNVLDRESVFDEYNVFRDDVVTNGLSHPELRKYTKNYLDGYYAVPKVISKD